MSHANAALTPRARLRLARLVVEDGWPIARAAERMTCPGPRPGAGPTVRGHGGVAGWHRSLAPAQPDPHPGPGGPPDRRLPVRRPLSPIQIGARLGVPPSTVHAVLVRCRLDPALADIDRRTGEPIRRYGTPHAGALIHVDVKKLGNIPDGGGWRYVAANQGAEPRRGPRQAAQPSPRPADRHLLRAHRHRRQLPGRLRRDPHRRDTPTAARVPGPGGVLVRRPGRAGREGISDNGSCYRAKLWRATCRRVSGHHAAPGPAELTAK